MPSLFRSTSFLAGVAAAGALAGGLLMAPPSTQAADGAVMLATQDSKTVTMSITGVALAPDGSPAAKLPVDVTQMQLRPMGSGGGKGGRNGPRMLASFQPAGSRYKSLGKAVTDDSGAFTVKNVRAQPNLGLRVEIGEKTKSPWIIQSVKVDPEKPEVDLGKISLREKVGR